MLKLRKIYLTFFICIMMFTCEKVLAVEKYVKITDLDDIVELNSSGSQTSTSDEIIIVSDNNILTIDSPSSSDKQISATNSIANFDQDGDIISPLPTSSLQVKTSTKKILH